MSKAQGGLLPWVQVDTSGSLGGIPAARTYATLVSHGDCLYLFGGYGEAKGRFNDVYEYNCNTRGWRLASSSGDVPKPVYLHSAVTHGNEMIVFGGNNGKECADLYYYDLPSGRWSKHVPLVFMNMNLLVPQARYGHASCVYGQGQLLVVGGCKSNNQYYKDTWSMDLASKKWRKLEDVPLELAYHSLFTWQDRAYLFGGYNGKTFVQYMYVLDSYTGKWNIVQASGQAPPPMCGAATVIAGNDLFVFGGYTEKGHTNDFYRFNMPSRTWTLMPTANKPQARAYLQAAVVGDRCHIFGGYDGSNCISDFRSIQLPIVPPANNNPPPYQMNPNSNPYGQNSVPPQGNAGAAPAQNIFLSDSFFSLPPHAATDQLLQSYGNYSEYISRQQLQHLVAHLANAWNRKVALQLQSNVSPGVGTPAALYPFDTSRLPSLEALGFSKEHILHVMGKMHQAGQNTRNTELVADMCLREPPPPAKGGEGDDDIPRNSPRSLDRQNSERAELKQKLKQLQEKEEDKSCKICMDDPINTVLLDCGHLATCDSCAESLKSKSQPCPICQRPIRATLKVYWS